MVFSPKFLTLLVTLSVVTFVLSLLLVPWIVCRIPEDYFLQEKRTISTLHRYHPAVYFLIRLFKNIAGIMFIVAGFLMLFLPGQGVLTMLIGLGLTDFPGKFRLERKIIRNKRIFKGLNWIRKRAGAVPLRYPSDQENTG